MKLTREAVQQILANNDHLTQVISATAREFATASGVSQRFWNDFDKYEIEAVDNSVTALDIATVTCWFNTSNWDHESVSFPLSHLWNPEWQAEVAAQRKAEEDRQRTIQEEASKKALVEKRATDYATYLRLKAEFEGNELQADNGLGN